jgi:hypothetical protein
MADGKILSDTFPQPSLGNCYCCYDPHSRRDEMSVPEVMKVSITSLGVLKVWIPHKSRRDAVDLFGL